MYTLIWAIVGHIQNSTEHCIAGNKLFIRFDLNNSPDQGQDFAEKTSHKLKTFDRDFFHTILSNTLLRITHYFIFLIQTLS